MMKNIRMLESIKKLDVEPMAAGITYGRKEN
jgi:hypothetical protein